MGDYGGKCSDIQCSSVIHERITGQKTEVRLTKIVPKQFAANDIPFALGESGFGFVAGIFESSSVLWNEGTIQ